jgi:transcriptional regulator with XRE-family HTH domain
MPKRHPDQPVLQRFGANVRAWREQQGLTRDQLGERLGTDGKNVYRLESGTENLTLVRAQRIADQLGKGIDVLLREPEVVQWQRALAERGWLPTDRGGVPVYDLVAAGGPPNAQPQPSVVGHVRPPRGQLSGTKELLIAHVIGDSMQPRIPSDSWCLFGSDIQGGDILGAVVLVAERDGSELWAWTVKRVEQIALTDDDTRLLTLRGTAEGQAARTVHLDSSGDVRIVGRLVRVL